MRAIFFVFVLLFVFLSFGQAQSVRKEKLETQKLELEVDKMKMEQGINWFLVSGSIVGAVSLLWTIISGIRTLNRQQLAKETETISLLLKLLNSQSEPERLSAARGLTRYIDKVTNEILAALTVEESEIVRETLRAALINVNEKKRSEVLIANSETLRIRAEIVGRLRKLELSESIIAAKLELTGSGLETLKKSNKIEMEFGTTHQNYLLMRKEVLKNAGIPDKDDMEKYKNGLFALSDRLRSIAESSRMVISFWIRHGHKLKYPVRGVDLTNSNFYEGNFAGMDIDSSLFSNGLIRHADFSKSEIRRSDFTSSDLFDSCIKKAKIIETTMKHCHLRKVRGDNAEFIESNLDAAVFSDGTLLKARFHDSSLKKAKFNGTDLRNASFKGGSLSECEFNKAKLNGASMANMDLYGAKFLDAVLDNARLSGSRLNGADLRNASLKNADLENAKLNGANVSGVDFSGANLENVDWTSCIGKETAIFSDNS